MSNSTQLTHPELMSKEALLKILNNRCIEVPNSKVLNKAELVEIFKRVALPLPQRNYVQTRHLGEKMSSLRLSKSIPVALCESNVDLKKVSQYTENGDVDMLGNESNNCSQSGRLKPPIDDILHTDKKIPFSNSSKSGNRTNKSVKRKIYDKSEISPVKEDKKRQKIIWP